MAREPVTPPRYEDLPDMVTVETAQAFLQVGRNCVYELIKRGDLAHVKFGKLIRIPKQALIGENGHRS